MSIHFWNSVLNSSILSGLILNSTQRRTRSACWWFNTNSANSSLLVAIFEKFSHCSNFTSHVFSVDKKDFNIYSSSILTHSKSKIQRSPFSRVSQKKPWILLYNLLFEVLEFGVRFSVANCQRERCRNKRDKSVCVVNAESEKFILGCHSWCDISRPRWPGYSNPWVFSVEPIFFWMGVSNQAF